MTRRSHKALAFAASSIVCLLAASCGSPRAAVDPSIEFTTIPRADAGGPATLAPVAGRVKGARSTQRVVLFARSGDVWWVQPFRTRPFTNLEPDSTWKAAIHLGTEYAAMLVEPDYRPPATTESLPSRGGAIVAVATTKGSGTVAQLPRRTLSFSGYDWVINEALNNIDARNASIDAGGHLHLMVARREGRWTMADVGLTRSLGYGTYVWEVRDASPLDPAAALRMLTWDDLATDQHNRALEIEIASRKDARRTIAQYFLQPEYVAANVFRFPIPSGRLTHSFRWDVGRASFKTTQGVGSARGGETVGEGQFTSGVPVPGGERVHITLAYADGDPPGRDVEVVVEKFVYFP